MTDKQQAHSEPLCELLPWFASGTLNEAEAGAMEQHLRHCQACSEEFTILRAVQDSVHDESLTVLAPKSNTEQFLARLGRRPVRSYPSRLVWATSALAASVALVAVVLIWTQIVESPAATPTIYQTVTSTGSTATFDYVLLIEFDPQADRVTRDEALRALAAESIAGPDSVGNYRVVMRSPAYSMDELEDFRLRIEADPSISSAAIIAVELPVESR